MLEKAAFSKQPDLKFCWHPLAGQATASASFWQWLKCEDVEAEDNEHRLEYVKQVERGCQLWKESLAEAEKTDQILYVHEHPNYIFSPSDTLAVLHPSKHPILRDISVLIPDSLLFHPGTVPVFTIRHPYLSVPSAFKALQHSTASPSHKAYVAGATHTWNRLLYDHYLSDSDIKPIVVDADDYTTSEAFIRHFCGVVGVRPEAAIATWPRMGPEGARHPALVPIQRQLLDSQGLEPGRKGGDVAWGWWKGTGEFSEQEERWVDEVVELAMPHYEYLRGKRLRM